MSLELIVLLQLSIVLLVAVILLALLLKRQKMTIQKLQDILLDVKDEFSGEALLKHLKRELDNTTAHCRQQTVDFKGDLSEEDLAITLRYTALKNELKLANELQGDKKPSWREHIKEYIELAASVNGYSDDRIENSAKILNEVHQEELDNKNSEIDSLKKEREQLAKQVNDLKPLQSFVTMSGESDGSRVDLEQALHKALLALCENFPNSENLRELVYLVHEAFHESDTVIKMAAKESANQSQLDSLEPSSESESVPILEDRADTEEAKESVDLEQKTNT